MTVNWQFNALVMRKIMKPKNIFKEKSNKQNIFNISNMYKNFTGKPKVLKKREQM